MSISNKDIKKLYGKAAGRCSICRKELFENDVNLGEMAHIIAKSNLGPRGDSQYDDNINGYENLILLCLEHHKLIDQQPEIYPEIKLHKYKKDHENWVDSQLNKNKFYEEDSLFLKNYLDFVPFLVLERLIGSLPRSLDLDFFVFTSNFEECCKDNPHLYPLNNGDLVDRFIQECYVLEGFIHGSVKDGKYFKNVFLAGDSKDNNIYINKEISYVELNKIYDDLNKQREVVLLVYKELICFIRTNYPEINLNESGKSFYEYRRNPPR